jgi:diguanylate cyclase (GGDEF)-like protein
LDYVPIPRPTDPAVARAAVMIGRARGPLLIAMVMVGTCVIGVPILLGLPSLGLAGVAILGALALSVRAIDGRPERFRLAAHLLYGMALAAVAYAVFGLDLPPVITVYFPAIVLLGAAHILGARAALCWAAPSIALVAAGVFLAPAVERTVDPGITFAVRAVTLLTILSFAVSFRRAHDRQSAELLRRATTDDLTGLANRLELERALDAALLRASRYGRRGALIFIDLDGVKRINDTLGHAAGDVLIRETGARIAGITRSVDTAARLGGDEFVILVSEFDDRKGGEVVARKLLAATTAPLALDAETVTPSASIGVALFPDSSDQAPELLRLSDDAMYQAKRAGGGRIVLRDAKGTREVV